MIGKVIKYNKARGFGFIKDKSGQVFMNYKAVENMADRSLSAGQIVKFAVAQGSRGPQAVKVSPVNVNELH